MIAAAIFISFLLRKLEKGEERWVPVSFDYSYLSHQQVLFPERKLSLSHLLQRVLRAEDVVEKLVVCILLAYMS